MINLKLVLVHQQQQLVMITVLLLLLMRLMFIKKLTLKNKYDNDMLDKSLTVHEFVKNLLELINISGEK